MHTQKRKKSHNKETNESLALWHVGPESAGKFQASNCFLVCDEFNTLVGDKVKRSKADWLCTMRASLLIPQKDRYGREVSRLKMKKTNVHVRVIFPNTNRSAV